MAQVRQALSAVGGVTWREGSVTRRESVSVKKAGPDLIVLEACQL